MTLNEGATVGYCQLSCLLVYNFRTNGNRNEYSTNRLRNLQRYPNLISTLSVKTENNVKQPTAFTVRSFEAVVRKLSQKESLKSQRLKN